MNSAEQYKDEALRFLDHYPLDVCKRVADRLQGSGWTMKCFNVDVRIFESWQWTAKVLIKTDVTSQPLQQKKQELFSILENMGLSPTLYKVGVAQCETITHRKYDYSEAMQRRSLRGHWYEFNLEFKPAMALELSVLEEEV